MRSQEVPPKLVYASSSSVYGANSKVPFSELDEIPVQKSMYAMTKKGIESVARTYHSLYDIRSIGLRFFTVYGTLGRPDMSYYKFSKAITKGKELLVYNLGRGHPRTLGDMIDILEKELGMKANTKGVPTPGGEVLITYADISRAQRELCYKPSVD